MTLLVVGLVLAAVLLWPAAGAPSPVHRPSWSEAARRSRRRRGRRRRRAQERLQADLTDLVSLLASPLRAGAVPGPALATVAQTVSPGPDLATVLAELVEAGRRGAAVGEVWLRHAERLDSPDLGFVARAWQLTERTGAPLAEALESAERVLRARQRARERVATAAAGPRSSMVVLAGLPCAGPMVGLAFGLSPAALYLSSLASLLSAVAGVVLGLGAWLWAGRIVSAALRTGCGLDGHDVRAVGGDGGRGSLNRDGGQSAVGSDHGWSAVGSDRGWSAVGSDRGWSSVRSDGRHVS